jgi:hypothetical protein
MHSRPKGKEIVMRLFAILAVLMVMGTSLLGCKAEGEVGDNDMNSNIVAPR